MKNKKLFVKIKIFALNFVKLFLGLMLVSASLGIIIGEYSELKNYEVFYNLIIFSIGLNFLYVSVRKFLINKKPFFRKRYRFKNITESV